MFNGQKVAAVIPARDEQATVGQVVSELRSLHGTGYEWLIDEIVVCDNGSMDATAMIANMSGARVAYQARPGYGIACQTALAMLNNPDIVIFIDADRTFQAEQCRELLQAIDAGAELVIGARTPDRQEPNALSVPQRIGNRLACSLIRRIWRSSTTDIGPFRAIRYRQLQSLAMEDKAFGWTVEMQVKALSAGLVVKEIPVNTRSRESGHSKISGTVTGVLRAAHGILGTIFILWWRQFILQSSKNSKYEIKQEEMK